MTTTSEHKGLLLGIIVLITLVIICQLTNFLNPIKDLLQENNNSILLLDSRQGLDTFFDTNNLSNSDLNNLNRINYLSVNKCNSSPCSQIEDTSHARIPCSVYQECLNSESNGGLNPYQYTDQDNKVLMLNLFHELGKEATSRGIPI